MKQSFAIQKPLTVVLSNDNVSGVMDEVVLLRCAVLRIFRLAACTILTTMNREDESFDDSLLKAVWCKNLLINLYFNRTPFKTYVLFWQHFLVGNRLTADRHWTRLSFDYLSPSNLAAGHFQRRTNTGMKIIFC